MKEHESDNEPGSTRVRKFGSQKRIQQNLASPMFHLSKCREMTTHSIYYLMSVDFEYMIACIW